MSVKFFQMLLSIQVSNMECAATSVARHPFDPAVTSSNPAEEASNLGVCTDCLCTPSTGGMSRTMYTVHDVPPKDGEISYMLKNLCKIYTCKIYPYANHCAIIHGHSRLVTNISRWNILYIKIMCVKICLTKVFPLILFKKRFSIAVICMWPEPPLHLFFRISLSCSSELGF